MGNFMYVKNKRLFDKDDKEVILRGVGLGGWMLPEGYMWGCHKYYDRPRRFEELINYYMEDDASSFWDTYYKTWISDKDFELIKSHGYDSVRLPLNYRMLMEENDNDSTVTFKEAGFDMIEYTLKQCELNNLYVILDMHGAPGGQTGANIDDSKDDYPHLYENRIYQEQLITLWKEIAKRYKDNETVIMLDLLNEPIPKHHNHLNKYLEPLHEELIKEIRTVNTNHIISVEGANWATDFSTFTKKYEDNIIIHFHKYWNAPSMSTIERFLDKREELDLPLFMGEGGENDLYWYSSNFKMYYQNNISWNFWAYKKRENHNSIISFDLPEDWHKIFDKENPLPKAFGKELLLQFLEHIQFEKCTINQDVTNHLFCKDEFFTSGGLYDYLGRGESFDVTEEYDDSPLRSKDKTNIVDKDGNPFKGVYSCHNEEEKANEVFPYVKVSPGDFYNYSFSRSDIEKEVKITITHYGLDADFYINGHVLEATIEEEKYILEFKTDNSDNILTIEPISNGIIKLINFK